MTDVKNLIESATATSEVAWRPVGDRRNNSGTIRIASDPALAMVERITNATDGMLELGRAMNAGEDPSSPRMAARQWFGVPAAGLGDMTDGERRNLGKNIVVTLAESDDPKRPTVVVEDHGIGQHPNRLPDTILSLNSENKAGKTWTSGTYGQGGSTTFGFSRATVILSRRHPSHSDGGEDRIGWTVVIEDDTLTAIQPFYKYLVRPDSQVHTADPAALPDFGHGTRCIHIAYDVPGWATAFTTEAWQFLHSALFEPILPFMLTSTRSKDEKYGSRIVIGNATRLDAPEKARGEVEIAHRDSVHVNLGSQHGTVDIRYWVVRRPAESDKITEAAAGYTRADAAIAVTLNGQRQDSEARVWIKDNARLPFLYKNMIVQVDADRLTPAGKREYFVSTRERGTKSELRSRIFTHLRTILESDEELARLNHEEKERLLQKSTAATNERVRKRLGKFIKTKMKDLLRPQAVGKGTNGQTAKPKPAGGGGVRRRSTDDSALHNVPTYLKFESKRLRVYRGAMGYGWVAIDAKNGYLPRHEADLVHYWEGQDPGSALGLVSRSELLGGRTRWMFEADESATVGDFVYHAELESANGTLTDAISITVADRPAAKQNDTKDESPTGPDVRWVSRDAWEAHEPWEGIKMDSRSVGYVSEDPEQTIIWVNRHLDLLDKALSGPRMTPESVETGADRYQYPVACGLWLQHQAQKDAKPKPEAKYLKAEAYRLAEAVVGAIYPDVDAAIEDSAD